MSCFEGENGRKPLIPCKTVRYTYIMTYMARKLLNPRKFWHQGCWGLEHVFGHQNLFNVLGQHIDRDVGGPLRELCCVLCYFSGSGMVCSAMQAVLAED